MMIQMLYWQTLWTQSVIAGVVSNARKANSPAEQAAFTRRLAKLSDMRFVRYPIVQERSASAASEG